MLQQKARKQRQPECKLHNYLDRQQSFSAEHVGDDRAHNYFINSTAEACDSMERDDVIEQLNGGGLQCHREEDHHAADGPIIKLKSKIV